MSDSGYTLIYEPNTATKVSVNEFKNLLEKGKDDDEDIFADGVNRQASNDGDVTDEESNQINGYPKVSYMDANSIEQEEEDNDRPRLVLANPDYDSDDSS